MSFVEDPSVFYAGEFSELFTLNTVQFRGIFDNPFATVDSFDGDSPQIETWEDWLPSFDKGDTIIRNETGENYSILEPQSQGDGSIVLRLEKP